MKLRRLLYRKPARIGTLQDLVHVARRPPKQIVIIRRIGDQSAGLDVLAEAIDGGQFVLGRELRDAAALAHQKSVPRHQEAIRPILRQLHERYLVDRGADLLLNAGRIGPGMADALKVEARRRAEVDHFYGLIVFAS